MRIEVHYVEKSQEKGLRRTRVWYAEKDKKKTVLGGLECGMQKKPRKKRLNNKSGW